MKNKTSQQRKAGLLLRISYHCEKDIWIKGVTGGKRYKLTKESDNRVNDLVRLSKVLF
jgi:hypothetical protein